MDSNGLDMVTVKLIRSRTLYSNDKVVQTIDAIKILSDELQDMDRESIWILNLQSDNRVINASMISVGTVSQSETTPREIIKAAILSNAANMIMIHNHPSGSLKPSEADYIITRRMVEATSLVGINLLDHVIVGNDINNFYSMEANKVMPCTCDNYFRYKNNVFTNESITIRNIDPDRPLAADLNEQLNSSLVDNAINSQLSNINNQEFDLEI